MDERLRTVEREWKAGSPEAGMRWVRERVRSGGPQVEREALCIVLEDRVSDFAVARFG